MGAPTTRSTAPPFTARQRADARGFPAPASPGADASGSAASGSAEGRPSHCGEARPGSNEQTSPDAVAASILPFPTTQTGARAASVRSDRRTWRRKTHCLHRLRCVARSKNPRLRDEHGSHGVVASPVPVPNDAAEPGPRPLVSRFATSGALAGARPVSPNRQSVRRSRTHGDGSFPGRPSGVQPWKGSHDGALDPPVF
jgi:hypothetical protein